MAILIHELKDVYTCKEDTLNYMVKPLVGLLYPGTMLKCSYKGVPDFFRESKCEYNNTKRTMDRMVSEQYWGSQNLAQYNGFT